MARFSLTGCADCPLYRQQCRVKLIKSKPPTSLVCPRWVQVVLLRHGMSPANNALRASVESAVRSFKHIFPAGKLLARGVIRSLIVACCSALMVNCRRVHQYRQQQRQPIREHAVVTVVAECTGLISYAFFGLWVKMCHFVSHSRAEVLTRSYPAY